MRSKIALFFLLAVFVSGAAVASASVPTPVLQATVPTAAPTPTPLADSVYAQIDAMNQAITNLYQRISPSVVHVTTQTQAIDFFYGTVPQEGTGSGFVYDNDGHIVTNDHVISGADQVNVLLAGGTSLPATVIGYDSYYDLAVLHVDAPANVLTPLQLGDSTQLQVGQSVAAIGNPFGLEGTLTTGHHQRARSADSDRIPAGRLGRPSRPTPPSTPAIPAGRCSICVGAWSASTPPSTAPAAARSASASPCRRASSPASCRPDQHWTFPARLAGCDAGRTGDRDSARPGRAEQRSADRAACSGRRGRQSRITGGDGHCASVVGC